MNVIAVILIVVVVVAVLIYFGTSKKEGFWMLPSRSVKVEKVFKDNKSGNFYQVPGFQSMLSPRFSNVDYGANIRSNMPPYNVLGVPYDPLMNTAKSLNTEIVEGNTRNCPMAALTSPYQSKPCNQTIEPFSSGYQSINYVGAPGVPLDPHSPSSSSYTNGNYEKTKSLVLDSDTNSWPTTTVAEPNTATLFNENGELSQPIVYDRYIYVNKSTRHRGAGDPIRGDLPIVPVSGNWFIPSQAMNPNTTLQHGALNVMGGVNNEINNSLANLIWNSSGGTETTIGGVDMAKTQMTHQVYGAASAAQNDVRVTSFP